MKRILLPILIAAAATACAKEPSMNQVSESLRVDAAGGKVLVHVTVNNGSDRPVWVPAAVARAHELTRREFDVQAGGKPVDYAGRMVKRGPITADDYVRLAPHARLENTVDITGSYAWPAGSHAYTLAYEGSYLTDIARLDSPTSIPVASAAFTK
jgi:hypothetical protein